jgi:SAM-dependent methyltransferase
MGKPNTEVLEIFQLVQSYEEFRDLVASLGDHEQLRAKARSSLAAVCANGIHSEWLGPMPASAVVVRSPNWRESLCVASLNARQRAVLDLIARERSLSPEHSPAVYTTEAQSLLARELRLRFSRFVGSEYTTDPDRARRLYPIPVEDIQNLSLQSDSFDLVCSLDVFEHIPDIVAALGEIARVLTSNGLLLATFPFTWGPTGICKSRMNQNGVIENLQEPEFHGDPINGHALVFTVPGWDILEQARSVGLEASMMIIASTQRGLLAGENLPMLNVLVCRKPDVQSLRTLR